MIQTLINLFKPTPDWKKVTELYYKGGVLTVTTLDNNIKEYDHIPTNKIGVWMWRKRLSKKQITDQKEIDLLDRYYHLVTLDGKRLRGGWVKSLR